MPVIDHGNPVHGVVIGIFSSRDCGLGPPKPSTLHLLPISMQCPISLTRTAEETPICIVKRSEFPPQTASIDVQAIWLMSRPGVCFLVFYYPATYRPEGPWQRLRRCRSSVSAVFVSCEALGWQACCYYAVDIRYTAPDARLQAGERGGHSSAPLLSAALTHDAPGTALWQWTLLQLNTQVVVAVVVRELRWWA